MSKNVRIMSYLSQPTVANNVADPFQLERLADELAARESLWSHNPEESAESTVELPVYSPLTHENKYLNAESFNVEDFLLSRSHTSLPDLRIELRDYLATLKEELVKLINDDYEAFISLSTDLKGEGERLNKLSYPLQDLRSRVLESQVELHAIQNAIQEKLEIRAVLREEKALLHLLLKISESMTRLESLLLIAHPTQDVASPDQATIRAHLSGNDEAVNKVQGNSTKHLGRVAAEYTQLLYHVKKAESENCAFVKEVKWRIDRIHSSLSSDLDHLFAATIGAFIGSKGEPKIMEVEKTKLLADLTDCFRIYDILGLWRDAEDILRREIIRDFVKKTIFPGALTNPHSPIAPRTPFRSGQHHSTHKINYGQINNLPSEDDPLAALYNQILRFIEQNLYRIMEVAEKVTVISPPDAKSEVGSQPPRKVGSSTDEGFQILANVVWEEVGRAIIDGLGNVIFAAGHPNEFLKHYQATQAFLKSLELLAPSNRAVQAMHVHPLYLNFENRWQLPVYFQLRWKDIIGKLEGSLAVTRIEPSSSKSIDPYCSSQAAAVWAAICTCWSPEVYLADLAHRFWKLTLQILSRYRLWLDDCSSRVEAMAKLPSGTGPDKTLGAANPVPRSATPTLITDSLSLESMAADDEILKQYATAVIDIEAFQKKSWEKWNQDIRVLLPSNLEGTDQEAHLDALRHSLTNITSLIPPMSAHITNILTRRCCDALLPVRSIPSQFRAMSNKQNPTEPNSFISSILRPIKQFFGIGVGDAYGRRLKDTYMVAYSSEVFNNVANRYIIYLSAMKKTEESLKRLKKGKKSTFSLFGGANTSADDEGRDEERIRAQMILDVEAFGKDALALGVTLENNEVYKILRDMVNVIDN